MPLFDFTCGRCGFTKEVLIKSSEFVGDANNDVWCPHCDFPMRRQVSAPGGFDLRGGGYYKTDFRDKK